MKILGHEQSRKKQDLKKDVQQQQNTDIDPNEQKELAIMYKQMARDYWDRWQWEMRQRKEEIGRRQALQSKSLHQIDPSQLSDPIQDGKAMEIFIGRGSFSIVRLKIYRGMYVAEKQFRTRSLKEDVLNEAQLLSSVCHPYLPYIFGVCTATPPYRIVTQFHGIDCKTVTLQREIHHRQLITSSVQWMIHCSQLLEAINYLHCEAQLLHNDIKEDNVLLSQNSLQHNSRLTSSSSPSSCVYHIVLTDFGKATRISCGRRYHLSEREKEQYRTNFPQLAPEVINGSEKQSIMSDMYAVGVLFKKMCDHGCFRSFPETERSLLELIDQCISADISRRLTANQCAEIMKTMY